MKIIVGLGNPGRKYQKTRHNVGFMAIDRMISEFQGKPTVNQKLRSEVFETNINNEKVIFVKPLTYMNLSGEALQLIVNYYKVDLEDILIIYDDLDLPTAKIRLRKSGSSGGHKGMQSIINHLKTNEIKRIRIGIATPEKEGVIDYVLGKFSKEESKLIDKTLDLTYDIIIDFVNKSFDDLMNIYN